MSVCFLKRERRGPGTTSRSSWRLQSSLSLFPAVAPVSLFYFLVRFCKQNKKKEKKKKAAALRVFVSQAASDRTQRGKNPLSVIAAAYLRLALSCCPAERTKVVSPPSPIMLMIPFSILWLPQDPIQRRGAPLDDRKVQASALSPIVFCFRSLFLQT